jgi:hypothetical protein
VAASVTTAGYSWSSSSSSSSVMTWSWCDTLVTLVTFHSQPHVDFCLNHCPHYCYAAVEHCRSRPRRPSATQYVFAYALCDNYYLSVSLGDDHYCSVDCFSSTVRSSAPVWPVAERRLQQRKRSLNDAMVARGNVASFLCEASINTEKV